MTRCFQAASGRDRAWPDSTMASARVAIGSYICST